MARSVSLLYLSFLFALYNFAAAYGGMSSMIPSASNADIGPTTAVYSMVPMPPSGYINSSFQGAPTAGPVLPPTDPDAQPSNIPQALAQLPQMKASIGSSNDGNVTITLTNLESETLYIDPDFSFLSPGVEDMVMNLTNAQGTNLSVNDNYEAVDADFVSPTSLSNLTSVAAGQSVARTLNLTEIFNVPESGTYTVRSHLPCFQMKSSFVLYRRRTKFAQRKSDFVAAFNSTLHHRRERIASEQLVQH